MSPCSRPAARAEPRRKNAQEISSPTIPRGAQEALAAAENWTPEKVAADDRPVAGGPASLLRSRHRHGQNRHRLFAGRQPIFRRDRQGQRDHQHPFADRADRQAGLRAVSRSPASPTPWAGARSAASPTCSPPIWSWTIPLTARWCRNFWRSPAIAKKPGLKAVDLFQAIDDGTRKGRVDHRHQSGGQPARRRFRPRGAEKMPLRRGLRCGGKHRHRRARPCAAAGRSLGREGRNGHQFRAPRLAPAQPARGARRGARRLAGSSATWPGAWVLRGVSISTARRRFSANMRRCPASPTTERAISTFPLSPKFPTPTTTLSRPFNGRGRRARPGAASTKRFFADGGFFTPTGRAQSRRHAVSRPRQSGRGRAIPSSSTPAACATSGTP